jgi:hypothetical protein
LSQYKVPQNIDLQDRIVGPLTLYQFLYLLASGMVFYATLKTPGIYDLILIGVPVGLLGLAFSFVKINDQPFSRFVVSLIFFFTHPKARVWHHGSGTPEISVNTQDLTVKKRVTTKTISIDQIRNLSQSLDKESK